MLGQNWEGRGWSVRRGGKLGEARSEPGFTFPEPLQRVSGSLRPSWKKLRYNSYTLQLTLLKCTIQ